MANTVNVSTTSNTVTITPQDPNSVNIGENNKTPITVNQKSTSVVSVASQGPQGNVGPQGNKGNPGELTSFENLTITGSLFASGANAHITSSGNISASGHLFALIPESSNPHKTVMYDETTGQFYKTGSYGGGGGNAGDRTFSNLTVTTLTSSLNISSSGNIYASKLISTNDLTSPKITFPANDTTEISEDAGNLNFRVEGSDILQVYPTHINLQGNITSSGLLNLSGNGTNFISGSIRVPTNFQIGVGNLDEKYLLIGDNIALNTADGTVTIAGAGGQNIGSLNSTSPTTVYYDLNVVNNISGSNISASGGIYSTSDVTSKSGKFIGNDIDLIVQGAQDIRIGQVNGDGNGMQPSPLKLYVNQTSSLILSPNLSITASGTIIGPTASFELYLGDGSQLTGVASTVDSSSFAITGSDVIFANITSSGNISASGYLIGLISSSQVTATTGSFLQIDGLTDLNILGNLDLGGIGVPSIESDSNLVLSASNGAVIIKDTLNVVNISASGVMTVNDFNIDGDVNLGGSGIPTIISDNNIILSASNGAVVIKNKLQLTLTSTGSVSSPLNGDIVYDTGSHKFMGYANGSWVAFH